MNCKSRLQAKDLNTRRYHLFCSDACASKKLSGLLAGFNPADGSNPITGVTSRMNTSSILDMCDNCKTKPKYTNAGITHPYCGRTCANLAKGKGPANSQAPVPTDLAKITNPATTATIRPPTPVNISFPLGITAPVKTRNRSGSATRSIGIPTTANPINIKNNRLGLYWGTPSTCQIPGCESPVYIGPNGVASKYCTRTHKQLGENGCISCREADTNGSVVFCQLCYNELLSMTPMIVEVPRDHERYKSVESQFRQKWLHNGKCPEVRAIYKIVSTKANVARYERYLDRVEAKGNFASKGKARGNENRRWHGTTRKCNIGDNGVTKFCSNPSCSLCCIMKSSFDVSFFARKTRFGRFGAGIYTSSTSSKSDAYSCNSCTSEWKAMLLNRVVVGNGYKMRVDNTGLTEPPPGYDSVIAEAGARLNYDELVVYNNDAIRPSYLVMYRVPK